MMNAQYLSLFLQDARDHLAGIEAKLVKFEKEQPSAEELADIMRRSHSCKGAAATMGFTKSAEVCHALEDLFETARKGERPLTPAAIDIALQAIDALRKSLLRIEKEQQESDDFPQLQGLRAYVAGQAAISTGPGAETTADDGVDLGYIRVDASKLDALLELTGELATLQLQLSAAARIVDDSLALQPLLDRYGRLLDELTFHVSQSRLVRLENVFVRFPRLVRDLAHSQNKQIRFVMEGAEMELDKTLVDHLVDPLIHLIRNAVDHGIESPEERTKAGKTPDGLVRVSVQRMPGFAVVSVEDDGSPIDLVNIRRVAGERGFTAAEIAAINDRTLLDVLCSSRFSTAQNVTDVSGRGVGLSAVRSATRSVGGRLDLERSATGKRFILSLPLELSVIRAILVRAAEQTYALPFVHTKRLLRVPKTQLRSSLGQQALVVDGAEVPVVFLRQVFDVSGKAAESEVIDIVLVEHGNGCIGVGVDAVLRNEDIMVKPVSAVVKDVQYFSGSTVLGDGSIALILDIPSIVRHQNAARAD